MSNTGLTDLGVHMIGDRIRLKELCTKNVSNQRQTDDGSLRKKICVAAFLSTREVTQFTKMCVLQVKFDFRLNVINVG